MEFQPTTVVVKPERKGNKYTVNADAFDELDKDATVVVEIAEQKNAKIVLTADAISKLKEANATLVISNGVVELLFPASNLPDSETEFKVKEEKVKDKSALVGYDFTIKSRANHKFSRKVTLTCNIDSTLVKNPENVKVSYYNETTKKWEVIGGEYKDGKITVETDYISRFGVFEIE
ncbi:hypothetical protein J2Y03_000572 [Neobacillus niacini]|uniref:hypothetical protein n=1 Tax=Neobacillus niacini TaxID=86668 RepID=UPI00285C0965|nr:hypothetical protein [Neobacillus niacini]MDR7075584.1 hypothetical protein [Neobacillus niacini]